MLDEVLFVLVQFFPVLGVLAQVDLVNRPEAGHLIFVHLPDVFVLDWQDYEAVRVLFKKWFGQDCLGVLALTRGKDALRRDHLLLSSTVGTVMLVKEL